MPRVEAPTLDEIKVAIVGKPGGNRQRLFRKVKETAVQAYFRALPDEVDKTYATHLVKAAIAEFIATFIFVFIGVGIVVSSGVQTRDATTQEYTLDSGRMLVIALGYGIAYGLAVAGAMAISGGHANPAVTLAYVATGRLDALAGLVYIVIQFAASIAAVGLVTAIWSSSVVYAAATLSASTDSLAKVMVVEGTLTFILVFVIWSCVVDMKGNRTLGPYLIGLAVFVAVLFGIPLTGPFMNPALVFGFTVWGADSGYSWPYWIAPFVGSLFASYLYDFLFIRTAKPEETTEFYEEIIDEGSPDY